jgi:uncharacterized membrane protein YdjX (TVP38/TMEM64 family)
MLLRRLEAVGIFGVSFATAWFVVANKHLVEHLLGMLGPFGIPVAIIIFALVVSAPFSVTDALAISNGVIFGPWIGSAINATGIAIGAILGYLIARRTAQLLDIEGRVSRLPGWIRRFEVGSPLFLIAVRVIPGVGGTLATQIAAALRVPLWRHVYTMCLVAIPFCTLLSFGGNAVSGYVHRAIVVPAERFEKRHDHRTSSPRPPQRH